MNRTVKPLLHQDRGSSDADAAGVGPELIGVSLVANGVVVSNRAGDFSAQHSTQAESFRDGPESGSRVLGLHSEALGVLGNEHSVQIVVGLGQVGDMVVVQLGDQPILE